MLNPNHFVAICKANMANRSKKTFVDKLVTFVDYVLVTGIIISMMTAVSFIISLL